MLIFRPYFCLKIVQILNNNKKTIIFNLQLQPSYPDIDDLELTRNLPREILLRIFSYLDVVSLCRCAQVKLIKTKIYL